MSSGFDTIFRTSDFPETAQHIQDAMKNGHPDILTISRLKVTEHRAESLKDIATKKALIVMNGPWRCLRKEGKAQVFGIYLHQIIEEQELQLCRLSRDTMTR